MNETRTRIELLTKLLRTGEDALYMRLRSLLREKGIDPATSVLADCFPDDHQFEFGLVVTADRRAFQFGLDYLHKTVELGVFTGWKDLTDTYESTPYDRQISSALEMLR